MRTVIGAGAVVIEDCDGDSTYAGVALRCESKMTVIIAEAGVTHNGDITVAKRLC